MRASAIFINFVVLSVAFITGAFLFSDAGQRTIEVVRYKIVNVNAPDVPPSSPLLETCWADPNPVYVVRKNEEESETIAVIYQDGSTFALEESAYPESLVIVTRSAQAIIAQYQQCVQAYQSLVEATKGKK